MVVKKPQKKKKKPARKKKKTSKAIRRIKRDFIDDDTFSPGSLKKYMSAIKKMRHKKTGKRKKKIGLTNTISYLNLLYNTGKARQRQPTSNLMKAHPYKYPSMIPDYNVDNIWRATKLGKSKDKTKTITNLNEVYRQLGAAGLIYIPGRKLPKNQRGRVRMSNEEQINEPLPRPPPPQPKPQPPPPQPKAPPRQLPSRPSRAPDFSYDSDSSSSSSSSDDD